ncbi:MAG: TetR/AcrR family transcriptional regulator [Verrucomicrobia bacterium]|nr:TetR/AcrR family transcriptional regulator [Verrucomicrobiota bacterium]
MRMRLCDSKLRLLQTAHELIWRRSYGSVGVDQICEQSRVKKGSFYHFFRSKSELTVAAYEFRWDQIRPALDRIFSTQIPPLGRLEAYFANIRRNQTEHFEKNGRVLGCPFASLGSELSTQDEAIRLMAQQISERKCRYLESTLSDAMEAGDIPSQDAKLLAQELHFYIVGLIQEAKISNNLAVLDRMESGAYRIIGATRTTVA